MRIAMFTDAYWPRVNGVTVSVDSFSRALISAGHEVTIVCPLYPETETVAVSEKEPGGSTARDSDPVIIRVPSVSARITKEDRLAKLDRLHWVFKHIEQLNPDIIHINTEVIIAEFGFLYARTHNVPVLYTFHTLWEDYAPHYFPMFPVFLVKHFVRNVIKNIMRRSYRVIVPTVQIEAVARKYLHSKNTFLLPTGIEREMFEHDEAEIEDFRERLEGLFPALKGKRILLFAGRVAKEKNIGFLINILPAILAKYPDTVLLIAGDGPDVDYYKDEAKKAGVGENCVFTGYFERQDLALVYSVAEIFLFPSLTDTQGLVTLEAMLSGTPVVAIGVMGTLTVMGGDNGGFMVKDDPAEFTDRVLRLLGDSELRRRKSEEAKEHARHWSIEELTKKLLVMYQASIKDYKEEYGSPIIPMWNLITNKRWWKLINKIIKKRTKRKWQEMLIKLNVPQPNRG
jgi:glycosyltransferase involved in cell wall biosynthesis